LFEAGHYPDDYEREIVRKYVFRSLIAAISTIASESYWDYNLQSYFAIPENNKLYFDMLIRNYKADAEKAEPEDIGILFREELQKDQIEFVPYIEERGDLSGRFGHKTYDFSNPKDRDLLLDATLMAIFRI
jgi:hypothetical protein